MKRLTLRRRVGLAARFALQPNQRTVRLLLALIVLSWSSHSFAAVCPRGSTLQGVDVADFDGLVDWNQVKASGRAFALVRAADGLIADSLFDSNYAGIKAAGMIRGAYQFFEPSVDPVAQANLLLALTGPLGPGDLPPILDVEVTDGVSAAVLVAGIRTWVSTIQLATGRTPIIYTFPGFWAETGFANFSSNPLWIGNWLVSCPNVPSPWTTWAFWQYTDAGSVPGIDVFAVDLDEFNGSMDDLQLLAGLVQIVSIEIKPGETPASINPNSHGEIPVAILSTATFNAPNAIDVTSLTFGRTGNEQSLAFCAAEDVNGDGVPDLVCQFHTQLAGFQIGDTVGRLRGKTLTNSPILGTGPIQVLE